MLTDNVHVEQACVRPSVIEKIKHECPIGGSAQVHTMFRLTAEVEQIGRLAKTLND